MNLMQCVNFNDTFCYVKLITIENMFIINSICLDDAEDNRVLNSFCTAYFFVYNAPIKLIVPRIKGVPHDPAHI
jgi:hypothetical protein